MAVILAITFDDTTVSEDYIEQVLLPRVKTTIPSGVSYGFMTYTESRVPNPTQQNTRLVPQTQVEYLCEYNGIARRIVFIDLPQNKGAYDGIRVIEIQRGNTIHDKGIPKSYTSHKILNLRNV